MVEYIDLKDNQDPVLNDKLDKLKRNIPDDFKNLKINPVIDCIIKKGKVRKAVLIYLTKDEMIENIDNQGFYVCKSFIEEDAPVEWFFNLSLAMQEKDIDFYKIILDCYKNDIPANITMRIMEESTKAVIMKDKVDEWLENEGKDKLYSKVDDTDKSTEEYIPSEEQSDNDSLDSGLDISENNRENNNRYYILCNQQKEFIDQLSNQNRELSLSNSELSKQIGDMISLVQELSESERGMRSEVVKLKLQLQEMSDSYNELELKLKYKSSKDTVTEEQFSLLEEALKSKIEEFDSLQAEYDSIKKEFEEYQDAKKQELQSYEGKIEALENQLASERAKRMVQWQPQAQMQGYMQPQVPLQMPLESVYQQMQGNIDANLFAAANGANSTNGNDDNSVARNSEELINQSASNTGKETKKQEDPYSNEEKLKVGLNVDNVKEKSGWFMKIFAKFHEKSFAKKSREDQDYTIFLKMMQNHATKDIGKFVKESLSKVGDDFPRFDFYNFICSNPSDNDIREYFQKVGLGGA